MAEVKGVFFGEGGGTGVPPQGVDEEGSREILGRKEGIQVEEDGRGASATGGGGRRDGGGREGGGAQAAEWEE